MHICFLCDEYPPGPHGGIGSLTQTMGRRLVARGHRVSVVGIYRQSGAAVEDDHGVRVVRLPHSRLPWTGFLVHGVRLRRALRRLHAEWPIDVVEGSELSFALLPRRSPWARVIRLNGGHHFFATTLGRHPRPWRSWLERRSFARADHLCAVSEFVAKVTRPLLALGERPIEILPNPVADDYFRRDRTDGDAGLIVFVGTLCEKKGVRQLVLALPKVVAAVPEARLQLIGRDTVDRASGVSFAERLRGLLPPELAARLEFTGHLGRAEVVRRLAQADVAAFPSHMESQGLVIVEAMAGGKAVVTSRTGPGPEIVEHGLSGLLCDPHDPTSIADQLISLLTNPALKHALGRAARQRAADVFSEAALYPRAESFYRRCADASRGDAASVADDAVRVEVR
ncbi:MAG: glycosyltransferase family 4 protein [Vicinamibacterales bacterium]